MRDRDALKALSQLLDVQRAQRTGAEASLAEARETERRARDAAAQARCEADAAQADWMGGLAEPLFPPEYQRGLAGRMLAREHDCAIRTGEADQASPRVEERRQDWCTIEARVRGGERGARNLARRVGRRDEERRLGEIADRIAASRVRR